MMRTAMIATMVLALTGCAGREPAYAVGQREPISLRDEGDECGASMVQSFVGIRANDVLREEITRRSAAREARWIAPETAVTMDFRGDRLNAELDQDGVITALRCG